MTPPPVSVGLLVCGQVIVDRLTGNPSAINCLTGLIADHFPWNYPLSLFTYLTNGRGRATLRLTVTPSDDESASIERRYPIEFIDVVQLVTVSIRSGVMRFAAPGYYEFVLHVDEDLIAQRLIHVRAR